MSADRLGHCSSCDGHPPDDPAPLASETTDAGLDAERLRKIVDEACTEWVEMITLLNYKPEPFAAAAQIQTYILRRLSNV